MKEIKWKPDMTEAEYAVYVMTCVYLHIDPMPREKKGEKDEAGYEPAPQQNKTL